MMLQPLLADELAALPGVAHGFFTRRGGVSRGIYASLNCGPGSGDEAAAVRENRARVAAHLGAGGLISAHQVHGAEALIVDGPWPAEMGRPRADALVTATRGLALGVQTADCAPILLCEPRAGVIAAAHAGWRGALAGILEAAVAAMEGLGAQRRRIAATVGPSIGPDAYEVGPEFEAEFLRRDAASGAFFQRGDAGVRPRFDLPGYVLHRLRRAGIAGAGALAACTYTLGDDFFSYRRSRICGEADYGRQISAIVLTY
jgi:YfiH family protein